MKVIDQLRDAMAAQGVDYYYITTADPHFSEYINAHYKEREFISGFTGSNGNLLVMQEEAYLWTDGRYYVQAEKELAGSGIGLMRMGHPEDPDLLTYLKTHIKEGEVLAFDGNLVPTKTGLEFEGLRDQIHFHMLDCNLVNAVWGDERPEAIAQPIEVLPSEYIGEALEARIAKLQNAMKEKDCDCHFISKLEDQMWLFGIRGKDIPCNPVAYAFTLLFEDQVILFIEQNAVSREVEEHFASLSVCIRPYSALEQGLEEFFGANCKKRRILLDESSTSYRRYCYFAEKGTLVKEANPTTLWKAIKNPTEIQRIQEVYLLDSLILTRFLYRMEKEGAGLRETQAAALLDEMRLREPLCRDLSFPTISAFGGNAAMMHYEAQEGKDASITSPGILLVDSGGQYLGGTTDVTRSIVFGELEEEVRIAYTKATIGMLRLMNCIFLKGCTGRNLDIIARQPLWEIGLDYKCGTGHGIGYMLNVHEGPQNISYGYRKGMIETEFQPGMLVSDEPGVYIKDSYGIRIENILLCKFHDKNATGEYLTFEPLTLVPIDRKGISPSHMEPKDLDMLNAYHQLVYERLSPFLEEKEKMWLFEQTKPIS